jgi:CDP-glucose 4,6-dehydratase
VIDRSFWRGRRVLLTGHTGFKGAWTSLLLASLGADVHGYALPADNALGVFDAAKVDQDIGHHIGDVRDSAALRAVVEEVQPEIILHMAAQSLVRRSYAVPIETYATNVMGTVHLLDAARAMAPLRAIVVVTSDKCYDNVGSIWGYRETDRLGGSDPYSNSKGCAELVVSAYRKSFFSAAGSNGTGAAQLATGRAGNVIGGGDWSLDRLVPDAMRAFADGTVLRIRNPASIRPWQHVLDPVLGYLRLAEHLVNHGHAFADGWNFGPSTASEVTVDHVADKLVSLWGGKARWQIDGGTGTAEPEAAILKLDSTKSAAALNWQPLIDFDHALRLTVAWYKAQHDGADMRAFTLRQIHAVVGEP